MSSQGVLVLNPGHVDPGFHGPLTVRIMNVRLTPKALIFGTPIFTVIFHRLAKETVGYGSNKPRHEREIAFKAIDIEQNPKTLLRLLKAGDEKPLMTGEEIDRRIEKHWTTRVTLILTGLTFVLAFAATIFAAIALFPKTETKGNRVSSASEFSPKPTIAPSLAPTSSPGVPVKP